jgi:hypothetical protein
MQGRFIDQWRDIMKKYFNGFCEEDIGLLSTICNEYLACRVSSCFAQDRNMTALIEKIEKAVK